MENLSLSDLRYHEQRSILDFMVQSKPYIKGSVLDFGSGTQPYKWLVEEAGAVYCPYDRTNNPASRATEDVGDWKPGMLWDTAICNQVLQYVDDPQKTLWRLQRSLEVDGHLIMTYPTHWPEFEDQDLHRFTKVGMEKMLREAGFHIERHNIRHSQAFNDFYLVFGYGVIAYVA